jgi:hypothetical protein
MRINLRLTFLICLLGFLPIAAHADGIDLAPYFTRVFYNGSALVVFALILLFMSINYILNFVFIGFPAMRFGDINFRQMARDLIFLTLGGQIADRIGALLAAFGAPFLGLLLRLEGEDSWVWPLVILNFIFAGLAIAILTLFFCRRRWCLSRKPTFIVMGLAAIFTNPAYLVFLNYFWWH